MFKYACERGTYIIANQIVNKKTSSTKKTQSTRVSNV